MDCKKVFEIRKELTELFKSCGVEDYTADAALIVMHAFGITKTQLLMGDAKVSADDEKKILSMAKRRCSGEPVRYIIGECEFMSLKLEVNKNVLIPRPDTEVLVEAILDRLPKNKKLHIMDIGCGSGCIGISLLHYLKCAAVTAVDISKEAIMTAQRNAIRNGVGDRISFLECDVLKELPQINADCIVSNPPYIKTEVIPTLERGVREFEPYSALDGGLDGLEFYRRISKSIKPAPGGILAFEIGYDQGDAVSAIMAENSYKNIEIIKDIEGRSRVVLGYLQNDAEYV